MVNGKIEHIEGEILQALLDDELDGRLRNRVKAHLDRCTRCAGELEELRTLFRELDALPTLDPPVAMRGRVLDEVKKWEGFYGSLDRLPRFVPSPMLAGRVLAGVRAGQAPRAASVFDRLLAAARKLIPSTRKGKVFAGGLLTAPALGVMAGVAIIAMHPLLTFGGIFTLIGRAAVNLAERGFVTLVEFGVGSTLVGELVILAGTALSTPGIAAVAFLTLWFATFMAAWVLYRNAIAPALAGGRHVQISR